MRNLLTTLILLAVCLSLSSSLHITIGRDQNHKFSITSVYEGCYFVRPAGSFDIGDYIVLRQSLGKVIKVEKKSYTVVLTVEDVFSKKMYEAEVSSRKAFKAPRVSIKPYQVMNINADGGLELQDKDGNKKNDFTTKKIQDQTLASDLKNKWENRGQNKVSVNIIYACGKQQIFSVETVKST